MTLADGIAETAPAGMRERRCIVTGEVLPETKLVRFVAGPDGRVVPDVAARLPGRGLWVRASREAVARAAAKGLFARAARAALTADAGLADRVEAQLLSRLLDGLGLARRAGRLLLGFDAIERELRHAKVPPAVLVGAADAGGDGVRKLRAAAKARGLAPAEIACCTGAELSLALGRPNVVHAALKPGPFAERLVNDAGRLEGFRPLPGRARDGARAEDETGGGSEPRRSERQE